MRSILTSQLNFRDLGGIAGANGLKIKTGLLFRSGDLSSLSENDLLELTKIKLSSIIDFRAQRELDKRPDKIVPSVREVIHLGIYDAARDQAEKFLERRDAAALENVLIGDYTRMVDHHQHEFSAFLKILAQTENLPLVFHCAAGKDRTGLASVFLLVALGVDMNDIWKDYMATNDLTAPYVERIIQKVNESGQEGEILRPLLEVRREYLQAALDRIDQHYDGITQYVQNVLMADVDKLRERYLTLAANHTNV